MWADETLARTLGQPLQAVEALALLALRPGAPEQRWLEPLGARQPELL